MRVRPPISCSELVDHASSPADGVQNDIVAGFGLDVVTAVLNLTSATVLLTSVVADSLRKKPSGPSDLDVIERLEETFDVALGSLSENERAARLALIKQVTAEVVRAHRANDTKDNPQ